MNICREEFEAIDKQYGALVHSVCWKVAKNAGVQNHFEDVHQEGQIALLDAIRGFDPQRKTCFSTYLYYCVRNAAHKYVTKVIRCTGHSLKTGPGYDPLTEGENNYSPFDDLSNDALSVLHILGDMPEELRSVLYNEKGHVKYGPGGRSFLQRCVSEHLQSLGWTARQTANAFLEITRMLASPQN